MCPKEHGDWRPIEHALAARPLAVAAVVCVLAVVVAAWQTWAGLLVIAACAAWLARAVGWGLAVGALCCGLLSLGVAAWRDAEAQSAAVSLLAMPVSEVSGRVAEDASGSVDRWRAPVVLGGRPVAGQKVWWVGRGELPVEGARVTGRGRFVGFEPPRNPGEFDRAQWAWREGLVATLIQSDDWVVVETPMRARAVAGVRQAFRGWLTQGLDESSTSAMVIRAVVMGERPDDADALVDAFRLSGCLHVFSVSGLHVAMVAAIGWWALGLAGVPKRVAVSLLIPLVFAYAWLTGANPPAVRAAWMAVVFLGAFVFRRRPDLLNALGAVLLVGMLWDGRMVFRPGVQLSYGVVAAIALGLPICSRWTSWLAQEDPYLPRSEFGRWRRWWFSLRRWVAGSLGVSLAAGIGSAPLTAWHFGLLTPVSVVASVVMVPLVFLVLALGLLSVALAPLPPVSRAVVAVNGRLAETSAAVAEACASLPGGHFYLRQMNEPGWIVYALERGESAACFADGRGGGVLFDCGGAGSFQWQVLPSLTRLGVAPESVVLSHPDGGHLGGGRMVWESLPIQQVVLPVDRARSPSYREWVEQSPAAGIEVLAPTHAGALELPDGARLEVLHVPDPEAVNMQADHRVMVCRIHWRGWRLLWTGDAGMAVEDEMLDAGVDVTADVVLAGRHRSDLSLSDRFLLAVSPKVVIVANNPYPLGERVDDAKMRYWRGRGVRWIELSKSGGVSMRVDQGALQMSGFFDGREVVLRPN